MEMLLPYLKAFAVGGAFCALGQVFIDYTKLTPARILVAYVVAGVILGGLGIYQPIIDFAGAGATVPLSGFGALLAKGRLTGIQFDTLFTGGLYLKISRHAIRAADRLREALRERGCRFYVDAPANQIFIILKNEIMEQLRKEVVFSIWAPYDSGHTIVRFVTSWGTRIEDIEQLIRLLPDQLA